MGKQYKALNPEDIAFINEQKLFYLASCSGLEVNLSPKGLECIYVRDPGTLIYLDYPGSGNRTARDIRGGGEVTLLFNAFEGPAKILRLFCKGELIEKHDDTFEAYFEPFNEKRTHVRRIIRLNVYAVETSCGMGVPKMQFLKERTGLRKWIVQEAEGGTLSNYIEMHETPPDLSGI